jgi:hypothetical protein
MPFQETLAVLLRGHSCKHVVIEFVLCVWNSSRHSLNQVWDEADELVGRGFADQLLDLSFLFPKECKQSVFASVVNSDLKDLIERVRRFPYSWFHS